MIHSLRTGLLIFCSLAMFGLARAQISSNTCYAISDGANNSSSVDQLVTVNKTTGATVNIGNTGTFDGESLALWPNNNALFTFDGGQLVKLSLTTGAKTNIGPVADQTVSGPLGNIVIDDIDGLTFDSTVDPPILYAAARRAANAASDLILIVNTNTGLFVANAFGTGNHYIAVSNITANLSGGGTTLLDDVDDIAHDPATDTMYAILNDGGTEDHLITINLSTGASTDIGVLSIDDAEGLSFFVDGSLFVTTGSAAPTAEENRLYDVDKANGLATNPRVIAGNIDWEGSTCFTSTTTLVGDKVWRDNNQNGIQDGGEPGVSNVTVSIYRVSDNGLVQTKQTDGSGLYSFVVPQGDYYIIFTLPSGYAFTTQTVGSNTAVDSNPNVSTGRTANFNQGVNETDLTIDAGLICLDPIITCPPTANVQCPGSTLPAATGTATATSPCGCTIQSITFSDAEIAGCGVTKTITRTWTATDACGNVSTCQQTINQIDTTGPVLAGVPANTSAQCNSIPAPPTVTATDACSGSVPVVLSTATNTIVCTHSYTLVRTWTATDPCGNVTAASQTITVTDTTLPTLVGLPTNLTASCSSIPNPPTVTATDNCDTNVPVVFSETTTPGSCPQSYTLNRTWTATDDCGNVRAATRTVTVTDLVPPVVTCPPAVTVQCLSQVPSVNISLVSATDNCAGPVVITHVSDVSNNQTCPTVITRTYRGTDGCGNSATCTQTITIQDTTVPVLTCPTVVTVQCLSQVPSANPNLVVASDNCGGAVTVIHESDSISPSNCPKIITRTYRGTDSCGNTTTCSQTITVQDTTPPVVTCPPALTVECITQVPGANIGLVSATDNCSGAVVITHVGDVSNNQTCPEIITRTYRATDACGNASTCTQTITVDDTIAPALTCPAAVTVECIADVPAPNTSLVVATDNCDANVTVTHVGDVSDNQTCPTVITRTYKGVDDCGNETICTQLITVDDTIAPVLTCPAAVTVECIADVPAPNPSLVVATDNCDANVTVTHVGDVSDNQTCPTVITRTYRGIDDCGNETICTQLITVDDTIAPVLTCPAAVTVECIADMPAPNTSLVVATDNCDTNVTVTHVGDVSDNQTCPTVITRTYKGVDDCGNETICTQLITVDDTIAPVLTCPVAVTVECIADVPAPNTSLVVATDNCDANVTVTHVGDVSDNQTCPTVITRTYRGIDDCGNETFCTQLITVDDTIAPVLTCPVAVTVECIADVPAPNTSLVVATDNCDANVVVTHVGDVSNNQTCPTVITRTYKGVDDCGNETICTQTITVDDTIAPALTCPVAVTVECIADVPAPNTSLVVATDNCDANVTVTHVGDVSNNQTCPTVITRTYRGIDDCGNETICTQLITVDDTIAPVLTCPVAVTVECIADVPAPNTSLVVATDNCDANVVVTHVGDVSNNQTCPTIITRTYRGVDDCGNETLCTQTITVDDTIAPALTCPVAVTVECIADVPAPNTSLVVATDNCDANVVVTHVGDVSNNQTCPTVITRTYRGVDDCGNETICTQTITVDDTIAPALTCPVAVTVECIADVPAPNTSLVLATDNCDANVVVTHVGDVSNNQTCPTVITRTYRGVDDCGNETICTQTITVDDTIAPALTCPVAVTVECIADVPAPNTSLVVATDNCDANVTVTHVGDVSNNQTCPTVITRTYKGVDDCGNETLCTQTITVDDTIAPALTCPVAVTVECIADVPAPNTSLVVATDNCDANVVVTHVGDVSNNQTCPTVITRTYRGIDDCGNETICTQTITVDDTIAPALTCPVAVTVECIADVPAPNTSLVVATDNCDANVVVTHVGDVSNNQTCPTVITRTYKGVDDCGNETLCTQTITVDDTIAPALTCPVAVTVECIADVPAPNTSLVVATDNCDANVVVTHVGDVSNNQTCPTVITRTYRGVDDCGNETLCTQLITVDDTIAPVLTCPVAVTVECIADVPAPNTSLVVATDNCDANVVVTHVGDVSNNLTCPTVITRTYRGVDDCGNETLCTQTITVDDTIAPALTCPVAVTVECIADVPAPNTSLVVATDNCDANVTVTHVGDVSNGQTCPTVITRTYRGVDDCGNETICTQTITVDDTIAPALTCPVAVTVECIADVPAPNTSLVVATDNCDANVVVTHVGDVSNNQTCPTVITRTYRGVDDCGNETICTQTITVDDTIVPVLTCPVAVTVECIADVPAPNTSLVVATDNCDANVVVTHVGDVSNNLTCPTVITRTYRGVDDCGNETICTQLITVDDTIAPVLTCPAAVTVECIADVPAPNPSLVVATDNCDANVTVTHVGDVSNGQTCPTVITRTYKGVDDCGNETICTQLITVDDTIAPALTCPAAVTVECIADVPAPNTSLVVATDNCDANVTVTHVGDVSNNQTCPTVITRTYRGIDDCGNETLCTQLITVDDTIAPVLTCPAAVTVECIADVPAPNTSLVVATDNCDANVTVTHVGDVSNNQTCPTVITRTYKGVDDCGNETICTQLITVDDTIAPVLTCPAAVTVECIADVPAPNTSLVVATDNCDANVTVTHVGDVSNGQTCPTVITRTYRGVDDCGNETLCTQLITVDDTIAPVLTCPVAVTVECIADVPAPNTSLVVATDNCDANVTVTHVGDVSNNQTCPTVITRTYRGIDDCGNETICTQLITVDDTIAPVLTCPAAVTVECIADVPAPNTSLVVATDNCDANVTVTHVGDVSDNQTCPTVITRTYRGIDDCGNETLCTQLITVDDTIAPVLTCPVAVTVECIADVPAPNTSLVVATDNCDANVTVTHVGDVSDNQTCPTVITRTYRGIDDCGNETLCTQLITVDDTIAPVLTCPAAVTVECIADVPAPNTSLVVATDNCDANVTVTHVGDVSNGQTCPTVITRTYKGVDDCGNETICTQFITVDDTIAPVLTCPAAVTVECIADVPAPNTSLVLATDNCDANVTVTHVGDVSNGQTCPTVITRTYKGVDDCGNETLCTQLITVDDTIAPVLTCPAAVTVECIADVPAPNTSLVIATDNCDANVAVTHVGDVSNNQTCPTVITRTYKGVDDCGNETICTQLITVDDTIAPVLTCPAAVTVECIADVPAPNTSLVLATDNCDANVTVTHVGDVSNGQTCPTVITRTYKGVDDCGNETLCTQLITVDDTIAPVLTCPAAVTVECIADVPEPNTSLVVATDNCDANVTVTHVGDVSNGQTCPTVITRTYKGVDDCGNETICTQLITVDDTIAPVLTCPAAVTVECIADVPAPNTSLVVATDNCDANVTVTHVGDVSNGQTCPTVITRTYRGVDDCGNETICTQLITVDDTIAPVLTCPAAVTVECIADVPAPNTSLVVATDNCDANVTVTHVGDVSNGQTCPTVITRTYKGVDDCGNETLCTQLITVDDTIAPVLTCPAAVTVECIADVPAPNTSLVVASDNCDANVTVTHVGDVSNGLTCPTVITRTYRGVDDCGNETICTQLITVDDTIAPVLTCPAAVTVECIADVPAPNTSLVVATDNCDVNVTVTHVGDVSNGQTCPTVITRTYRGVDDCGNETLCTQLITVRDTIAPILSAAPAAVTVECSAIPTPATLTATDNCDASVVPVLSSSTAPGNCPGNFVVTRTWTATDACGNFSTRQQVITVRDTTPPVITCPVAITVECGTPVPAPNTSSVTATDNCGTPVVTHVGDVSNGQTCPQLITRTYRAVDSCGNETTCSQLITVRDTTPPVQTQFPLDSLISCDGDLPPAVTPGMVDACDSSLTVQLQTITQLSSVNCGKTVLYRWTIRDDCGNFTRATQRSIIRDRTRPVITSCGPVPALTGDANCQATLPPVPYFATDNCGGVPVVTQNPAAGTILGPGNHTVTLTAVDECGNVSLPCTITVTVNCLPPDIEILKTVYLGSGGVAGCPGIEKVHGIQGSPVTYCFLVLNNGQVNLSNVTISDSQLGIAPITIGTLNVGQSVMRHAASTITADLINTATVSGNPPAGPPVTDDDPAEVDLIVPGIDIQKTVREGANQPCPGQEEIFAVNGEIVTYCFKVTNTGNSILNQVVITDPFLNITPIFVGTLQPGQAITAAVNSVVSGNITNIAGVVGYPPLGPPVTDVDPAKVFGFGPGLTLEKTVYAGHNGGIHCPGAEELAITGPTQVTYCFTVRNISDTSVMYDVVINDPLLGISNMPVGTLQPGQAVTRFAEVLVNQPVTNIASAVGDPPSTDPITNYNAAVVARYNPGIQLNKKLFAGHGNPAACNTATDTLSLPLNSPVTYCFEVVNTGDTYLNDVGINDVSIGVDQTAMDFVSGQFPLPPGGKWLYVYRAQVQGSLTNTAATVANNVTAAGFSIRGLPAQTDSDSAILIALPPAP